MALLGGQKRSIVLVPLPLQGHMTPMLQLGSILHSKGFSIIVAHTEFHAPDPLNHPEFRFLPLADDLAGFDTSLWNMINLIFAINNNCKAPLLDSLVEMGKNQDSHGLISCIIYDAIMYFADSVATHLKIPSIVLRTASAAFIRSYCSILQLQAENYFPLPESQLQEPVPDLQGFRFKDLPIAVSSKIPEFILDVFTLDIKSSVGIIWNTTKDLEDSFLTQLQQHYKVPIFSIGPFHKMAPASSTSFLEEDTGCIAWLDKQATKSVIYVSLGSLVIIDAKELEETAWGLANSGQPFLWVVRPDSVYGSEWLEQLPEGFTDIVGQRGLIVKWAPQMKVLAHPAVGGFFTHCGWNSTLESIHEEVPMICRPCFADQLMTARYITHFWKVGLELERLKDRVIIEKSIRRLMTGKEGQEMRQGVLTLKQKLEASLQKGGSSYQSLNDLTEFILSSSPPKVSIPS